MGHLLDALVCISAVATGIAAANWLAPIIFPWVRKPRDGRGPDRP